MNLEENYTQTSTQAHDYAQQVSAYANASEQCLSSLSLVPFSVASLSSQSSNSNIFDLDLDRENSGFSM